MRLRSIAFALLLGLSREAVATDSPRFSSGDIHSGLVEFEVDLKGAKKLTVSVEGDPSSVKWVERTLIHSDGRQVPLDKVTSKGGRFGFKGQDFVAFAATVEISNTDKNTTQINLFHDAPRAGDTKKIAKLTGDPRRGQDVFRRGTCTSCHALGGRGAQVGPDLATLGKETSFKNLIESIIAPDAELAKGFETNIITTLDGTPHLGFVVEDKMQSLSLKDSSGQIHRIDKKKIVSRRPQSFSLMPSFDELLKPQQIADLAAFLKAVQR